MVVNTVTGRPSISLRRGRLSGPRPFDADTSERPAQALQFQRPHPLVTCPFDMQHVEVLDRQLADFANFAQPRNKGNEVNTAITRLDLFFRGPLPLGRFTVGALLLAKYSFDERKHCRQQLGALPLGHNVGRCSLLWITVDLGLKNVDGFVKH